MELIINIVVFIHVAVNLLLTYLVSKDMYFSSFRKTMLLLLLWFVPFLGAIVVWTILKRHESNMDDQIAYTTSSYSEDRWSTISSGSDGGSSGGGGD